MITCDILFCVICLRLGWVQKKKGMEGYLKKREWETVENEKKRLIKERADSTWQWANGQVRRGKMKTHLVFLTVRNNCSAGDNEEALTVCFSVRACTSVVCSVHTLRCIALHSLSF